MFNVWCCVAKRLTMYSDLEYAPLVLAHGHAAWRMIESVVCCLCDDHLFDKHLCLSLCFDISLAHRQAPKQACSARCLKPGIESNGSAVYHSSRARSSARACSLADAVWVDNVEALYITSGPTISHGIQTMPYRQCICPWLAYLAGNMPIHLFPG